MKTVAVSSGAGAARRRGRGGFSMVEVAVSIVIVGGMLAAALATVGAARVGRYKLALQARGSLLAQDLMSEILEQAYEEPGAASGSQPGASSAELAVGNRSLFDDVDDYVFYTETPPKTRDGAVIAGCEGWTRTVTLAYAAAANLNQNSTTDTRMIRVVVTASFRGQPMATLTALKTAGWGAASP